MENESALAKYEDAWDAIVEQYIGGGEILGEPSEPSWEAEPRHAIIEVNRLFSEERENNRIMAEKMQGVVDRERALFEKERQERLEQRAARLRAPDGEVSEHV